MKGNPFITLLAWALLSTTGTLAQVASTDDSPLSWIFVNMAAPEEASPVVLTENRIEMPAFAGPTDVIRVKRGGLVHTEQLAGRATGADETGFDDLVGQLQEILAAHDASLTDVAKLNLYALSNEDAFLAAIEAGMKKHWPPSQRPAVTLAITRLPGSTKIAADAVFVTATETDGEPAVERHERSATLPSGRDILYVSGRAASGEIAEATSGTMTQLFDVLAHLGSEPRDVVQVKAFLQPMSEWKTVEREIEKSFGGIGAPPLVFVEWSSTSRATEIELIAAAPDAKETGETITYFTPPGDKSSPVYSRVARVHGDTVIYTRGLAGRSGDAPADEVRKVFRDLEKVAAAAGSDLRHLAKATYYVSDPELSKALNEVRPEIYDPERPPAASKVAVPELEKEGAGLLIDMIAAPSGEGE